jgi:hypothetical protein
MMPALMPRMRIPLWAAFAIPAAAYAIRSLVRGSVAPDLLGDAVVFGALALGLVLAAFYGSAAQRRRDELPGEMHGEDHGERRGRQDDEI